MILPAIPEGFVWLLSLMDRAHASRDGHRAVCGARVPLRPAEDRCRIVCPDCRRQVSEMFARGAPVALPVV